MWQAILFEEHLETAASDRVSHMATIYHLPVFFYKEPVYKKLEAGAP